jgi:hypothetical protein
VIDAAVAQDRAADWLDWFEPVTAQETRAAVEQSLAWSAEHPDSEFSRLNAARSRHYLEHGQWISKREVAQ